MILSIPSAGADGVDVVGRGRGPVGAEGIAELLRALLDALRVETRRLLQPRAVDRLRVAGAAHVDGDEPVALSRLCPSMLR